MKKIIAISLSLILCVSMVACSGSGPTPTETAGSFLEAVKENDEEALKNLYADADLKLAEEIKQGEEDTQLNKVFNENMYPKILDFDYELSNEKIDGEKASIDVSIKTYSLGTAFTNFTGEYLTQAFSMALSGASDDEMDTKGAEILADQLEKTEKDYEGKATLHLTQKDDAWIVDSMEEDDDFYNAITGGMIEAIEKINESTDSQSDNND